MLLKFWGTRGSIPVPGESTLKYGGNTPCVEVRSSDNELLIFDAGSGIRELGKNLKAHNGNINIFISHYHWDHIQGIPFFKPLYNERNKIIFYGLKSYGTNIEKLLRDQMSPNNFPIDMKKLNAEIKYKLIEPFNSYQIDGVVIDTFLANHPSPTLTYKVTENNKSIVYLTDNELTINPEIPPSEDDQFYIRNKKLIDFCLEADYLIHDSMYDEKSVVDKVGWGHSGNISIVEFSILAKVKNLLLFHYNPDYNDKKIDNLFDETCEFVRKRSSSINCIAAKEGLEINI